MLRRARLKMDYLLVSKDKLPKALFTFQIDATERSVRVRDMFVRLYETKGNNFSLTTGIFARPFGFEVNLSSSFRETPERGRMSQTLVPSERDIGMMITYEPQRRDAHNKYISANIGIFNGPGLSATTDFDNVKDVIGRITLKPLKTKIAEISGGFSILNGGWRQLSKYVYKIGKSTAGKDFIIDSSTSNIGKTAPKQYYSGDIQLNWAHGWGNTELRGEYWMGTQPGTLNTSANPETLPLAPTVIRNFNGAFFYFLQDIINTKNQLVFKYDWYDPNTKVKAREIGVAGKNFSAADIKYSTAGVGFVREITKMVKVTLYYEFVKNETTQLAGYTNDLKDNLFTCRLQFKF
ncbi:MAG: porin [Chitinophagaceae bacterium]